MAQLRETILADDITKKLVLSSEDNEEVERQKMDRLFEEEMKKYEGKTKIIRQNLLAQENIKR